MDRLFKGKVGTDASDETREHLLADADRRIARHVPPGYLDADKRENRHGDVLIWFELIAYAAESRRPLMFVTDDAKDDWWSRDTSPRQPRAELRQEMQQRAKVPFWMYDSASFIEEAQSFQRLRDEAETAAAVEEVEQVQRQLSSFTYETALASQRLLEQLREQLAGLNTDYMRSFLQAYQDLHVTPPTIPATALIGSDYMRSFLKAYQDLHVTPPTVPASTESSPVSGDATPAEESEEPEPSRAASQDDPGDDQD